MMNKNVIICAECGIETEKSKTELYNGQNKCIICLEEDPGYYKEKFLQSQKQIDLLDISIGHYVELLDNTNECLENLTYSIEKYMAVFANEFPEEFVCILEAIDKSKFVYRKNALNKLTRLSEEFGLYKFEHENFYEK